LGESGGGESLLPEPSLFGDVGGLVSSVIRGDRLFRFVFVNELVLFLGVPDTQEFLFEDVITSSIEELWLGLVGFSLTCTAELLLLTLLFRICKKDFCELKLL